VLLRKSIVLRRKPRRASAPRSSAEGAGRFVPRVRRVRLLDDDSCDGPEQGVGGRCWQGSLKNATNYPSTINSSATSVVTTYDLGGLRAGSVSEIDSELFYVWEANPASKTLTVQRGYSGLTAASHTVECADYVESSVSEGADVGCGERRP
jgi:hypothetical protein